MKQTPKEIKAKIVAEIAKTENSIEKFKKLAKPVVASGAIGRVSRMNSINNKTVVSVPLSNAKLKLAALRKILSQIGSDKFGQCLKCKKPIALGRIIARPESLLCVKCAA